MRRVPLNPVVALLALACGGFARAAEPRALLERAVEAQGGKPFLVEPPAERQTLRGTIYAGSMKLPMQGEILSDRDRLRLTLNVDGGLELNILHVISGDRGWALLNGEAGPLDESDIRRHREDLHLGWVLRLVPVLESRGAVLTPLGESREQGKLVDGVRVAVKGKPSVSLYFDRQTGLVHAASFPRAGEDASLSTTVFLDYRAVDATGPEEKMLRAAGVPVDGSGLAAFLRGRVLDPARQARIRQWIVQLGSESFDAREKAQEELVRTGTPAAALLRGAVADADPERARRARTCLEAIQEEDDHALVEAAVRLAAIHQPDGAAAVLLDLLPQANPALAREVRSALCAIGGRAGRPDPGLVAACDSTDPARRAAARGALGKDGGTFRAAAGRRLPPPEGVRPHRTIHFLGGKKEAEIDLVRVEYFNRFEDSVFTKP